MSPYLSRLKVKIDASTDEGVRGELEAKSACYLARVGNFEDAREKIKALRASFGDGRNGRVTVGIMIAEALVHHFERLDSSASDRIIRSLAISRFIMAKDLEKTALAWHAHVEFENSNYRETFSALKAFFATENFADDDALARVCNVLCKIAMICGDRDITKHFFHKGREYSLRNGDQAGIEALQHNKAAFYLAWVRAQFFLERDILQDLRDVHVEISSARSLQNLMGIRAKSYYIDLCDARLAILEGRYTDALNWLNLIEGNLYFPVGSFVPRLTILEKSYCLARLGAIDEAHKIYHVPTEIEISKIDLDEQLAVRWLTYQMSDISDRFGQKEEMRLLLNETAKNYRDFISDLRQDFKNLSTVIRLN